MAWIEYIILLASGVFALLLVALTWPGLWLMTMASLIYALVTHERYLGVRTLLTVFILTLAAEVAELLLGKTAIGRAGGGRTAGIGAAIGGVAGGIFLTFIPIPVISTIVGICLGTFIGAAAGEMYGSRRPGVALGVGWGAAKARVWALAAKLIVGAVMFLLIAWTALP
jgi:uncharacterized protein YqgC (DUF456 family)